MRMTASSIVTNESGKLLLIQRHDIRTYDVPGGGLDPGELPSEAAVRETFEETGLHVRPSQLLGLYHWPNEPHAYLSFYFRCDLLGGALQTSEETPTVAFFPPNRFPRPILPLHRQRLRETLAHGSAQPIMRAQPMTLTQKAGKKVLGRILFPIQRWRRRRSGQPPWPEPVGWRMGAFTIIRNDAGAVLWVKRTDKDMWNLPGGGAENEEPPWETAVRETFEETGCQVRLGNLTSINSYTNEANLTFNYTAEIVSGQLTTGPEAAAFAWFQPGAEPANCIPQHCQRAADACSGANNIVFRKQNGLLA
jgi:ADP-ribose pyrophosphatase YjhB (NUDIX family)